MAQASPSRFLLAGVMGWPVMHSRSPTLHYLPLAIEPDGLAAALRALHPLGFAGCNLTLPHKQKAMAMVDEVDAVAKRIGAISCVTVGADGSLAGSNNDCFGFIHNLKQEQPLWRADAGPAVVLGAGGGARAVCYALMQEGAKEIRIVNRSFERAQGLADEFRVAGVSLEALSWERRHDALEGVALAVNTTSQGMAGQAALEIRMDALPRTAVAADIIYVPLETPFLAMARLRGNPTVNGLGMLLHQARPAWKLWFDLEPAVTADLRQLIERSLA
jgi:shikimate dehydrogenase